MAKIPRVLQKIFASGASNNGQFGSAQAGTKVLTNDLAIIQALPAYVQGWLSGTLSGGRLPTLEEMQGLQYLTTSQLAYLFQEGIPEYDASTTYYANSIVKKPGSLQLYASLTNDNTGNALTVAANWKRVSDFSTDAYIVSEVLGMNGYRVWSDGFIEQWGATSKLTTTSPLVITYPIAFLQSVFNVQATIGGDTLPNGGAVSVGNTNGSLTNFNAWTTTGQSGDVIFFSAIGK